MDVSQLRSIFTLLFSVLAPCGVTKTTREQKAELTEQKELDVPKIQGGAARTKKGQQRDGDLEPGDGLTRGGEVNKAA